MVHLQKTILFLLLLSGLGMSAQKHSDSTKKAKLLVIPVLFRSPETRWAYGIAGSVSFKTTHPRDSATRLSNVQGVIMTTQRHQDVQAIDAMVYFPQERYILSLQTSHSYYPDFYWGLGPNTPNKARERYVFEQMHFNPHIKKKIARSLFAGLVYEYQKVYHIQYIPNGLFDDTPHIGTHAYKVSGLGLSICYDTRNASFWPTKGLYVQAMSTCFSQEFGSDYNDVKSTLDLRYFQKIFKKHVLAMQLFSYSNIGEAPIRELAAFGGPTNVRGYYQGRYRAKSMMTSVFEYRAPLFWRFSACAFIGLGNVYNKPKDLVTSDLKYAYGGGIRFAVLQKEKLNIRIDYGYYNKFNRGLYFTVGECF